MGDRQEQKGSEDQKEAGPDLMPSATARGCYFMLQVSTGSRA